MKKAILILGTLVVLGVIITAYVIGSDLLEYAETKDKDVSGNIEDVRTDTGGSVTEEEMANFKSKGLNPFGQAKSMEELTDRDYREYIHGMSHQKVKAEEKWGFYEINDERIEWLLDGLALEESQAELTDLNVYQDILERWKEADFSRVDEDHNTIWRLQGGTIGKATGILSLEEEQLYIDSQR